jgi:hypothetical protein
MTSTLLCDQEHLHEEPSIGRGTDQAANHGSLKVSGNHCECLPIARGNILTKRLKEPVLHLIGDVSIRIVSVAMLTGIRFVILLQTR